MLVERELFSRLIRARIPGIILCQPKLAGSGFWPKGRRPILSIEGMSLPRWRSGMDRRRKEAAREARENWAQQAEQERDTSAPCYQLHPSLQTGTARKPRESWPQKRQGIPAR